MNVKCEDATPESLSMIDYFIKVKKGGVDYGKTSEIYGSR